MRMGVVCALAAVNLGKLGSAKSCVQGWTNVHLERILSHRIPCANMHMLTSSHETAACEQIEMFAHKSLKFKRTALAHNLPHFSYGLLAIIAGATRHMYVREYARDFEACA